MRASKRKSRLIAPALLSLFLVLGLLTAPLSFAGEVNEETVLHSQFPAVLDPDQNFALGGLHAAAGQFQRRFADDVGDFIQGQTMGPEALLGYLHADFQIAYAVQTDLRYLRILKQFVAHRFGQAAQATQIGRASCRERV